MKEFTEKCIHLENLENPVKSARQITQITEQMHEEGWYFVVSHTDELMETITLFFERDIKL
jgi:hypothetical protein